MFIVVTFANLRSQRQHSQSLATLHVHKNQNSRAVVRVTKASNPDGRLFSYYRKPSDGKVRESLTHFLVLNHKSFRSQSFVLTAGLLHHTVGSHRERSACKDPPCIKHSGDGAQTGATFVTEQNTKYDLRLAPLCCNLSRCAFGASSND